MSDTVKVLIVFAPGGKDEGKTVDLPAVEAATRVREGRAVYPAQAAEKKAEAKSEKKAADKAEAKTATQAAKAAVE